VFACQAAASGFAPTLAAHHRSVAVGLYVSICYLGGSVGALAPSVVWERWRWPGCTALVVLVQAVVAFIGYHGWREAPVPQDGTTP
jgi:predicted MFS family arabinose efflux permease